jgi:D-sedoheptulose 7-phosphate isomerase
MFSNIKDFFEDYQKSILYGLSHVNSLSLEQASAALHLTRKGGGRVFVAGNGGSAAISEHLTCDFSKGTSCPGANNLKVHSLSSNLPLITALGNDIGYEDIFSEQMDLQEFDFKDTVILISSSGNSPNIIKAAQWAKHQKSPIIGLTGFDGGNLKDLSTISLHVPIKNYGIVEDCHQAIMHVLAQFQKQELMID